MGTAVKNILFVMYDQLRFDYLSCTGHRHLHTPNFDRLAEKGVRFTRTYVQSPICGASRMSTYTGRYVSSHGAQWNNCPLNVDERTMGDHLRGLGMETWLIGKTHMKADLEGMERLGISRDGLVGARIGECGFDVWVRDDGLHAEGPDGSYDNSRSPYSEYLKQKGYVADNPWHDVANAGTDENGDLASGFLMANAVRPANVRAEDSETAWLTDRTLDFLKSRQGAPWLAHVSYIKPHWPYIVPSPYHEMFGREHVMPANRCKTEMENAHPVYEGFMQGVVGRAFQRDEVREAVIPAYMGLIKQCDDEFGRILDYLEESGEIDNTMIIVTSDHGDYLGDHWMGEKDLFHEPSVKVPLIIFDPSPEADGSRGEICDALVEQIDLAATFVEVAGGDVPSHILEGRSLLPFLRGETPKDWRAAAFSEYDYSMSQAASNLNLPPSECRLFMVVTDRWKFMYCDGGLPPMLFDLVNDPDELKDLGRDPQYSETIAELKKVLFSWSLRMSQRTTISDEEIISRRGRTRRKGVVLGAYDENDVDAELLIRYRGPVAEAGE